MEDIFEEFGSGLLALFGGSFFLGIWLENMKSGGLVYEFVRQFFQCLCGS